MLLFGLKNCDTCKKAMKALPEATFVDVRADGVPFETLERALAQFGDALVNTRSTTWRNLDEAQRGGAPLELLQQHPTLMKRPLIEREGQLFLGWTAKTQGDLGL